MLGRVVPFIMKNIILFFVFFIFNNTAFSQITFNHRYHFGLPNAVLTSIVPTDSCYYATGVILPINSTLVGNIFVKFDLNGEVLFQKIVKSDSKRYQTWEGTLQEWNNDFLVSGYSTDSTGRKAIILAYDANGDTLFSKQYISPFQPLSTFIAPKDFKKDNNGFTMISLVEDSITVANNDIAILRLDNNFDIKWHKTYGGFLPNERPRTLLINSDGSHIIGARGNNKNQTNENYESQTWIFQIDTFGQIEWEYLSPIDQLEDGANAMIQTDDGGLIIASGIGTEIDRPSVNEIFWKGYIYKLDENFNKIWEIDYTDEDTASHWLTEFTRLIEVEDGYVAAGYNYDKAFPSPVDGWLVKFSPDGERIWSRKYHYLEDSLNTTIHQVYDMERTSDGGYIMVGQAKHFNQPISQQAWIIKVDEYGCLVPGCQIIDAVENPRSNFRLQIFPNPTSEQLNIYFSTKDFSSGEKFRLISLEGKVVKTFDVTANDTTYMMSVESVPSGIYFLQYLKNGNLMKTEQVVIQK